jgi:hypothetical protein
MSSDKPKLERLETLEEFAERQREIYRTINNRLITSTGLRMMLGRIRPELHDEFAAIYSHLSCFENQRIRAASYFLGTAYLFEGQEFSALKEIKVNLPDCKHLLLEFRKTGEEFYDGHVELYRRRIEREQKHSIGCLGASLYFMPMRDVTEIDRCAGRKIARRRVEGDDD